MDAALQPPCRSEGGAGGEARDRGLRVHAAGAGRASRRPGGADSRDPERRGRPVCPRGPGCRGRLRARRRHAGAAEEPCRCAAGYARASCRAESGGRPGMGRRSGRWLVGPGLRRGAGRALPRSALPALSIAVRGLRRPGARGDGVRDAGRHERRRRDRGGRRRRGRARRPARSGIDRRGRGGGGGSPRRPGRARPRARAGVHVGASRGGDARGLRGSSGVRPLVVIDADVLGRQRTGDETYVENLLRRLPRVADDLRFAAVTRRPELVPAGVEPLRLATRSQELRMVWSVPRLLRRVRPALAHFLHALPVACPCRAVVTIQDLSWERDPSVMGLRTRLTFKTVVPRAARGGVRVLAISERTKRDVVELYGVAPEKIVVTPLGVDPAFRPADGEHDSFLLYVSAIESRKQPLLAADAA